MNDTSASRVPALTTAPAAIAALPGRGLDLRVLLLGLLVVLVLIA
jgi:hypothetical protein